MGDQKKRRAAPGVEIEQHVHDGVAGLAVEIPRRFVGKQDGGFGDKGAGQGDALLLAPRKLPRIVGQAGTQADRLQLNAGAIEGIVGMGELKGQGDVLQCCHGGHQMKVLKDDAHMVAAKERQAVFVQRRDVGAGGADGARRRSFQAGNDQQKAGLSRTRRTDHAKGLARPDDQVDATQDVDLAGRTCQPEVNVVQLYGGALSPGTAIHAHAGKLFLTRLISRIRYGVAMALVNVAVVLAVLGPGVVAAEPTRILALGDSLTAGHGLERTDSFPVQLQRALNRDGIDAVVSNAGVSGDTSAGGRARLDWVLAEKPALAIIELGANDGLRGLDPETTFANLDAILGQLREAGVAVLLTGMLAPPNLGREYGRAFADLYPRLAAKHGVVLYPFFLDGVAADPALNQDDAIHPNAQGVAVIVKRIVPYVKRVMTPGG
jgi:acyl-CoA thioesterase I